MADVGEIRAKLVAETDQFEAGMRQAAGATEKFASEAEKNLGEVNKSLKAINWREAGAGIERMGNALRGASSGFLQAAGAADDLEDKLRATFRDNAAEVADWSQKIGTAFQVFSAEQVGGAAQALDKFGVASETNLRRLADVAAGANVPIESLAIHFGKFEKFGDSKSILGLQKAVGATAADLAQFGAVLDSNGKILTDTPARVDAAREAMERLLDAKFGGAMEAQSDAAARLAGEWQLFQQELGGASIELREAVAPALLEVVQGLRGLPPELKTGAALFVDLGGVALSAGGQALQVVANLSLALPALKAGLAAASGALGSFGSVLAGLGGPAGILIVSLGALAVATAGYTAELEKANKAAEDLLATEDKRAGKLRENRDLIGKNADEYRKLGKTVKDADAVIAGLQDQLQHARANGAPPEVVAGIQQRLAIAQQAKKDLSKDGPVYDVKPKPEPPKPVKVEESEKERQKREKKEAADKAKADKKAAAEKAKQERKEEAARRAEERKRKAEEAKRNRERTTAERAAQRKRDQAERKREREAAKQEKDRQKAADKAKKDADKKAADTKKAADQQKAVAAVKQSASPGKDLGSLTSLYGPTFAGGEFSDQSGFGGPATKDVVAAQVARNRAAQQALRDRAVAAAATPEPSPRGALGELASSLGGALKSLVASPAAISPAAAAAAQPGQVGSSDAVDGKEKAGQQQIHLTIELQAGAETQTQEVTLQGAGGAVQREWRRFELKNKLGSSV